MKRNKIKFRTGEGEKTPFSLLAAVFPRILISIVIICAIIFFGVGYLGTILIISMLPTILFVYNKFIKKKKATWWGYIKSLITIWIFISEIFLLSRLFGGHTIWGLIVISFLIAGYFIYRSWSFVMSPIRSVETHIFGKPIEEFKKNNEQVPKLKFVWKKKEEGLK